MSTLPSTTSLSKTDAALLKEARDALNLSQKIDCVTAAGWRSLCADLVHALERHQEMAGAR